MKKYNQIRYFSILIMCFYFSVSNSQSDSIKNNAPEFKNLFGSCEDGTKRALNDVENKIYRIVYYGLIIQTEEESKFDNFYHKYMASKYGISLEYGGCVVTPDSKCYSKKMKELIKAEFGANILERTRKDAKKLFNK